MKKFIFVIALALMSIVANAQVTYSKPNKPTFEWVQDILHTFNTDTYDLYIDSDNEFEDYSIVVKLGKGKEQAIKSLCNIKQMFDDANDDYTFNLGGHKFTKVFHNEIVSFVNGAAGKYVVTGDDLNRWIRVLKQEDKPQKTIDIKDLTIDLDEEPIPFQLVEVKPSFNGGDSNEFSKWVMEHIVYPKNFNGEVRVTLQFVIDKEGNLVNPKILRGISEEYNKEAMRVISMSPKWTAGKQNGAPINTSITFPVVFK